MNLKVLAQNKSEKREHQLGESVLRSPTKRFQRFKDLENFKTEPTHTQALWPSKTSILSHQGRFQTLFPRLGKVMPDRLPCERFGEDGCKIHPRSGRVQD